MLIIYVLRRQAIYIWPSLYYYDVLLIWVQKSLPLLPQSHFSLCQLKTTLSLYHTEEEDYVGDYVDYDDDYLKTTLCVCCCWCPCICQQRLFAATLYQEKFQWLLFSLCDDYDDDDDDDEEDDVDMMMLYDDNDLFKFKDVLFLGGRDATWHNVTQRNATQ